ncbi:MAG TPA: hypothetical protein VL882_12945 [Vicinamibacterales bacterium]|nr:hypothetical protein [Vicinamibacterales bacterium]
MRSISPAKVLLLTLVAAASVSSSVGASPQTPASSPELLTTDR